MPFYCGLSFKWLKAVFFIAACLSIRLEYAAGSDGPSSICLKYAKATESNRVFAMGGDM